MKRRCRIGLFEVLIFFVVTILVTVNTFATSILAKETELEFQQIKQLKLDLHEIRQFKTKKPNEKWQEVVNLFFRSNSYLLQNLERYNSFRNANDFNMSLLFQTKIIILFEIDQLLYHYLTSTSPSESLRKVESPNQLESLYQVGHPPLAKNESFDLSKFKKIHDQLLCLLNNKFKLSELLKSKLLSKELYDHRQEISIRIAMQIPYEFTFEYFLNFSILKNLIRSYRLAAKTLSKGHLHYLTSSFTFGYDMKTINDFDGSRSFYVGLKDAIANEQLPMAQNSNNNDHWTLVIENIMTMIHSRPNVDAYLSLLQTIEEQAP